MQQYVLGEATSLGSGLQRLQSKTSSNTDKISMHCEYINTGHSYQTYMK